MKKFFMMMAMMVIPFAIQAQTKFHDVEANDATGPVRTIKSQMMGRDMIINFTQDGKMQREGMSDAKYDADGYMQSAKMSVRGQEFTVTYKWENGKVKSQSMNIMGQDMTMTRTYNEKGAPAAESVNMGGQEMSSPFTDYKYDDKGNWISRKVSMMGQEMEQTRTIEYY
jgi:hypothetical protein